MVKSYKFIIFSLFVLLFGLVVQGCKKSDDAIDAGGSEPVLERGDSAARTVLVYMMAENSLARDGFEVDDLNEMKKGVFSLPNNCYLLAFVDGLDDPYICRFYEGKTGEAVCDTVLKFEEDFYSTDSVRFNEVLSWVLNYYPSENFGLVMWSHGSGWLYDKIRNRSIGVDSGKNLAVDNLSSSKWMEVEELAAVLKELPVKTDFVLFDACFMQCVEVAYAMRESAEWLIGSPAEIPGNGAPYNKIISSMFSFPFDPEGLIEQYKAGYYDNDGVVLSAVKCSAVENLAEVSAAFIPACFERNSQVDDSGTFSYLRNGYFSTSVQYPDFCDMNGQMLLRLSDEAYILWKEALDAAVPFKVASHKWYSYYKGFQTVDSLQYGGISMYVPRNNSKYSTFNEDFRRTEWYVATGWESAGW